VKAITNWERPVDGKAMQRFLGAVNYNREFSADFAKMSAPLEACRLVRGLSGLKRGSKLLRKSRRYFGKRSVSDTSTGNRKYS
jgi:hypothetical protein